MSRDGSRRGVCGLLEVEAIAIVVRLVIWSDYEVFGEKAKAAGLRSAVSGTPDWSGRR